ncbi:putative glycine-rich cell wall structural protein 1 [Juglans regia]|uniref:Glycine-rich cell wall structural protein 1 n=1 Tax=Juglans regia TaxID=51240 RepID=A0A2I4HJH4_JUGRE|nr:putative glycine-rich cell wall structural protein 1 [Juglans regia]
MKPITGFFLAFLLITASNSLAFRLGSDGSFSAQLSHSNGKDNNKGGGGGGGNDGGMGGFFGPGGGFNIPDFGKGWGGNGAGGGYGGGYGGPSGGHSKGGVIRPTVVCKEKGPCYNKKLTCPAKCFTSYSRSGKGYGGGGGGGGCTIDCKKKCIGYC